jgi:hypothetical protein
VTFLTERVEQASCDRRFEPRLIARLWRLPILLIERDRDAFSIAIPHLAR